MIGEYLEPLSSRALAHGFPPAGRGEPYADSVLGPRACTDPVPHSAAAPANW